MKVWIILLFCLPLVIFGIGKVFAEEAPRIVFEPKVTDLPGSSILEYFGRITPDTFFIVTTPNPKTSDIYYEGFRIWIGPADQLCEISVQQVIRFRDGGTTHIYTDRGLFKFISPFYRNQAPYPKDELNGKPLLELKCCY